MTLQLANVISDLSGKTGLQILRAVVNGERDPAKLADFRDPRIKASREDNREPSRELAFRILARTLPLQRVERRQNSEEANAEGRQSRSYRFPHGCLHASHKPKLSRCEVPSPS
jgi:hypothetical protein